MKVLVACEESQAVCLAFRSLGHAAYSCDLKPCSGGFPEYHIQADVFEVLKHSKYDLMVAHPPCTFLASSGSRWFYHPDDKHLPTVERRPHPLYPTRKQDQADAVAFVIALWESVVPRIAIENPLGRLSTLFRKPTQIIHPWWFGHEAEKTTGLWLKNLPKLTPTKIVGKGEFTVFKSGAKMPKWYADILSIAKTKEERQRLRSKTFQGIADAMADQWGSLETY
jgi:hypothetical protein